MGFNVQVWSKTKRALKHIDYYYGDNGLHNSIKNTSCLISLLPATNNTKNLLGLTELNLLAKDSYFINVKPSQYYLWNCFPDPHSFSDYWDFVGYTDNKKGDLYDISINLIKKYWEFEAKDSCLDHFHVISLEGLFKVADIKSLGRSVW